MRFSHRTKKTKSSVRVDERYVGLPDSVDANKIEATFKNGVLKVTLPKTAEAQKPAKKIEVKKAA